MTNKTTAKKAAKKTASKKASSKKSASKKVISKKNEPKKLVCATGANCFWVHNGPILKDLVELEKALDKMTDKVFAHHVSGKRNDFADWVETILKDAEAAAALRKSKKPKTAKTTVTKCLKVYQVTNSK